MDDVIKAVEKVLRLITIKAIVLFTSSCMDFRPSVTNSPTIITFTLLIFVRGAENVIFKNVVAYTFIARSVVYIVLLIIYRYNP